MVGYSIGRKRWRTPRAVSLWRRFFTALGCGRYGSGWLWLEQLEIETKEKINKLCILSYLKFDEYKINKLEFEKVNQSEQRICSPMIRASFFINKLMVFELPRTKAPQPRGEKRRFPGFNGAQSHNNHLRWKMDGYVESYPHVVDDAEFDAANGSGPDSLATPQFDLSSPTQDYDLISGSNDSADDDNNERKQKKKRVRTTTVSAACSTCRRRVRLL